MLDGVELEFDKNHVSRPNLFQRVMVEIRPIHLAGFACEIFAYTLWSLDLLDKVPNGGRPFDM